MYDHARFLVIIQVLQCFSKVISIANDLKVTSQPEDETDTALKHLIYGQPCEMRSGMK